MGKAFILTFLLPWSFSGPKTKCLAIGTEWANQVNPIKSPNKDIRLEHFQTPVNCPCELCKTYVPGLGYASLVEWDDDLDRQDLNVQNCTHAPSKLFAFLDLLDILNAVFHDLLMTLFFTLTVSKLLTFTGCELLLLIRFPILIDNRIYFDFIHFLG